ncbi:helix-turn-helix domain-containing protein [Kitasatospora xanthocidica]|uniref:helix-turn-helix domain-containing protein n=1 Tax=Kitasatospora xanthocidica TaxID=83382 RepID=UPI0019B16B96|nr:helix-turn-helix domain-containing protein [Kitasatospora xanthocidica]GHF64566.1 hypothetical protein GCM10018790_47960 [Kitasatospora xanthocidica]
MLPPQRKADIILSVLSGETTAAEAARVAGVSSQAISNWKRCFIKAGCEGLDTSTEHSGREQQLLKEIEKLKSALGDSYLQLREMRALVRRPGARRGPAEIGARGMVPVIGGRRHA